MLNRNADSSQGDVSPTAPTSQSGPGDHMVSHGGNKVIKSGPLFISSKGIGWTSWKKRWFILTRTSLVFFRSDPDPIFQFIAEGGKPISLRMNVVPQRGSEANLTLGGIDLNNSGSVVVKADKKLLTVLPDGREGRAFTLKAETSEDLYEWKDALENALAQAPNAALAIGQNGIFKNEHAEAVDGSSEQSKDRQPMKSMVIGRPILLALEDIDGTPSFLEKALRFIEEHGVKVEGILRQAADVDDVERRVREYEQGKTEFTPGENVDVIADCIKYVIRELPSSPVPASCCNALLEACRTDRGSRINAMRAAICETFPEPNRRLLQRILMMMRTVASHKSLNRMSTSAVAACMAPLLLRPLLAGDCEIDNDFDVGGDGSMQLLQAAAAANHAQAIVITLLEEYNNIFGEGTISHDLYSDSEESGSESEEATDDNRSYEDDYGTQESDAETDDGCEHASSGSCSDNGDSADDDVNHEKMQGYDSSSSASKTPEVVDGFKTNMGFSPKSLQTSVSQHDDVQRGENTLGNSSSAMKAKDSAELVEDASTETRPGHTSTDGNAASCNQLSSTISNEAEHKRPTVWGRTAAKKNLSMESIDYGIEDEVEIQRLEAPKTNLENRISEEVKKNEILQSNLERQKNALLERRQALEEDVSRLKEQLQKERDLRSILEAGLKPSRDWLPVSSTDEKIKADLEHIALVEADVIILEKKVNDLGVQLALERERNNFMSDSYNQPQEALNDHAKMKDKKKETDVAATPRHIKSRSKDTYDGRESEYEKKQEMESALLPNKHPHHYQQLDPESNSNSKSIAVPDNSSATESAVPKPAASTNSKRSSARGEGTNSTTSALTKLTNRLNFLKERRSQIANELQNIDKVRGSGQPVQNPEKVTSSESNQSLQNVDKNRDSKVQSNQNSGKSRRTSLSFPSLQIPDKGFGTEGKSLFKLERGRKSGSPSPQNLERGKKLESISPYVRHTDT